MPRRRQILSCGRGRAGAGTGEKLRNTRKARMGRGEVSVTVNKCIFAREGVKTGCQGAWGGENGLKMAWDGLKMVFFWSGRRFLAKKWILGPDAGNCGSKPLSQSAPRTPRRQKGKNGEELRISRMTRMGRGQEGENGREMDWKGVRNAGRLIYETDPISVPISRASEECPPTEPSMFGGKAP